MSIHTRPSSTRTSIRSPGPYGGRPETNRRSRSCARSDSDTPKTELSSESSAPWCWITYGTTESSRRRRSEARGGRVSRGASAGGKDAPQTFPDGFPERRRGEDLSVEPEGEHPVDERAAVADLDARLGPPVRPHRATARGGPPRHLWGERDGGRGVLVLLPGAGSDVLRGGEALRRRGSLTGVGDVALDPGDPERPQVAAPAVVPDHVPLPRPREEPVRLDLPIGDSSRGVPVAEPDRPLVLDRARDRADPLSPSVRPEGDRTCR